jgi:hypothetical protein
MLMLLLYRKRPPFKRAAVPVLREKP